MSLNSSHSSRCIRLLLLKKYHRTQYIYRATKLEAYIYEPFFSVEIVTVSGEDNWFEGWDGDWTGN